MCNEQYEKDIKKAIPFAIASKIIKYQQNNIMPRVNLN